MLQVLLAALLGILLGTVTGLTPGLHVNTLVALIVASLPLLLGILPLYALVALIVAMAVTHTFVDYILRSQDIITFRPGKLRITKRPGEGKDRLLYDKFIR